MLALHHAAKARERAFHLVRADAIRAARLRVIDTKRLPAQMQCIPVRGFVGMDYGEALADLIF